MKKIVHVDNSGFFRKIMRIFLTEQMYEVESFDNGREALEEIGKGDVSMVITGLSLSDMTGERLIKQAILSPHTVPFVALTGNQNLEEVRRLTALGVKAVILKTNGWREKLEVVLRKYL
jgi:DNA-binding NtrC family response regulator